MLSSNKLEALCCNFAHESRVISFNFLVISQGATLEEHSVECITSGDQRLMPQAVSSGDVISLMSFTAFSAASVKNKVRFLTVI